MRGAEREQPVGLAPWRQQSGPASDGKVDDLAGSSKLVSNRGDPTIAAIMVLILLSMSFPLPLEHAQTGFFDVTCPAGDQGTPRCA